MNTLVMKFGGNAVGTVAALTQVLSITIHEQKRWQQLVIVASALDGVTDMLLEAAHLAQLSNQRGYRRIAATLRTRHLALIEQLPFGTSDRMALNADIDQLLFDMLDVCQSVASIPTESLSAQISDQVIQVGEKLSARIIAALLRQNNLRGVAIDGTDIIITDGIFGNATPLLAQTRSQIETHLAPMLERGIIPVVTGFIGKSMSHEVTTMGRGGSDYTASILSLCTGAEEVWIWSDVDGMMSTDPREIKEAKVIPQLTYNEVSEMANFGARILHPRMIKPLAQAKIPLRIKNIYKPQETGTLITSDVINRVAIKAVTSIHGIGLSGNRSGSLSKIIQTVDSTFFKLTGSPIDIMLTDQSSDFSRITFVLPTNAGVEAIDSMCIQITNAIDALNDLATWHVETVQILTLVGNQLGKQISLLADILKLIHNIPVLAIKQGASDDSVSIIVPTQYAEDTLQVFHQYILDQFDA